MRPALAALVLSALALGGWQPVLGGEMPNIVFLLADDLGYGDLGCTGHPYARTPAIDGLAREGTLFRNFYCGGATCCPSRTAFMTSRFPATFQKNPAIYGFSGAVTITELLKQHGYRTGHFGKWHIGEVQQAGTYGIDVVQELPRDYLDPRGRDAEIADAAIEFIRTHRNAPFYVNVWFRTPHDPVNPPQSFVDHFRNVTVSRADFQNPLVMHSRRADEVAGADLNLEMRKRLGDVLQLDGQVARVLQVIDDLGLRDNTIVVFTSDNGPNMYGSAGPFRGGKHNLYEGGIHQPLIVRWPGRVESGRVDDNSVLAAVDWLPTLCSLAGIRPGPLQLDGEDVCDIWLGGERVRKKDLFWRTSNPKRPAVMRRGDWKLHKSRRGPVELYDLATDPGERRNVAEQHPDVVNELTAALTRWTATLPTSYLKGDSKDD